MTENLITMTESIINNKRLHTSRIPKEIEKLCDAFIISDSPIYDIIKSGIGKAFAKLFLTLSPHEEFVLLCIKIEDILKKIREKAVIEALGNEFLEHPLA